MNLRMSGLGLATSSLVLLAACGHENATPPPAAPAPEAQTTITAAEMPRPAKQQGLVNVSDEILRACQVHFDDVDRAPKFDFDRSGLDASDRNVLDQIATCVTTGPLRGRTLLLTGRADPRGETEYNMVLGSYRSNAVGAYLQQLGVRAPQLSITSRGELDAKGTDEATWAIDRRVDITLQPQ
jgi:peptidoglycan-associated lipoprotein